MSTSPYLIKNMHFAHIIIWRTICSCTCTTSSNRQWVSNVKALWITENYRAGEPRLFGYRRSVSNWIFSHACTRCITVMCEVFGLVGQKVDMWQVVVTPRESNELKRGEDTIIGSVAETPRHARLLLWKSELRIFSA